MPCSDKHFIPILDELRQREEQSNNPSVSSVAKKKRGGPRPGGACPERPAGAVEGARPAGRRGGPRPNSGPPRGNLNALKHGRYSSRHKKLLESLLEVPEARQALIDMANRNRQRVRKAELEAAYLLMRWLANHNPQGLSAAMDEASANIQSENDQTRNDQLNRALANMEAAFKRKISKNATKKRTPKPKGQPKP
jgi:hypothetical protein